MIRIRKKLDTLVLLDTEPYREERFNPALWPANEKGNPVHFSECYWDDVNKRVSAMTPELYFLEKKETKVAEIGAAFNNELENGHFFSATLQIEVDCRRSSTRNDLQNVDRLIGKMNRENIPFIEYKGYEGQTAQNVTSSMLLELTYEMDDYALGLYNKKWALEESVKAAATAEELNNIKW